MRCSSWIIRLLSGLALTCSLAACISDVHSSAEVYKILHESPVPVFVMTYKHGCHYCQELEPAFRYLEQVFEGQLTLILVDGKGATGFSHAMNIRSFPDLLLFGPGLTASVTTTLEHEDQFLSRYPNSHSRDVSELASFVSSHTSLMAHWPQSHVRDLSMASQDTLDELRANPLQNIMLVFVTPWMRLLHLQLFNGAPFTSVLNKLDATPTYRDNDVRIIRVDASNGSTALLTHEFRISVYPTVVLLTSNSAGHQCEIYFPLRKVDSQMRLQEFETLEMLIQSCASGKAQDPACLDFIDSYDVASIKVYDPVLEQVHNNQTQFNAHAEFDSRFNVNDELQDEEDEEEEEEGEESLFGSLREL